MSRRAFAFALALTAAIDAFAQSFNLPLFVAGNKDFVAGPGTTPGDVLELRVGPGANSSSTRLLVAVRSTGNNLSLYLHTLTPSATPAPPGGLDVDVATVAVLQNAQVFSFGGGCASGTQTLFPYIRNQSGNFRPFVVQATSGLTSVAALAIAGTDQIHSIDCASDASGQNVYYFVSNATRGRGELWRSTAGNPPTLLSANFSTLLSPFSGGIRPSIVFARRDSTRNRGESPAVLVMYQLTNGEIRAVSFDLDLLSLWFVCTLLQEIPPPTVFILPRELRIVGLRDALWPVNYVGGIADFNRDGGSELFTTPSSACAPTAYGVGPSTGGNGFGWAGYGAVLSPERNWFYVGNGKGLLRYDLTNSNYQSLTPPPISAGGPVDFAGGSNGHWRSFGFVGFSATPGSPTHVRTSMLIERDDDRVQSSSFEGNWIDRWYIYNQ